MDSLTVPYTKGLHEVSQGLYAYLQPDGSWGWNNAGLIVDNGQALLVDTLFDVRLTAEMLQTMQEAVPAAGRIGTLINTHSNGDHTFGNELVEGAEIISSRSSYEEILHEARPEMLAAIMENAPKMGKTGEFFKKIFGAFDFKGIKLTPPTRTFDGELTVRVGSKEVQLIEVGPAHTAGDIIVYDPSAGAVFTGDILFIGGHPVMWAGPVGNWIKALDTILSLNPKIIVPGHGPLTGAAGVLRLKGYFEYLAEQARQRYDRGMTAFEAAKDIPLEAYADWTESERVAVNLSTLYREFSGESAREDIASLFSKMAELALA